MSFASLILQLSLFINYLFQFAMMFSYVFYRYSFNHCFLELSACMQGIKSWSCSMHPDAAFHNVCFHTRTDLWYLFLKQPSGILLILLSFPLLITFPPLPVNKQKWAQSSLIILFPFGLNYGMFIFPILCQLIQKNNLSKVLCLG